MNLETIKQYVEQYLALITGVGTFTVMGAGFLINNKVNNGGVFTFRNPNNAIVQEVNNEVVRVAGADKDKKAGEITNKYTKDNFIDVDNNKFKDGVEGITVSGSGENKLKSEFVDKMKAIDTTNEKLKALSGNIAYDSIIGNKKSYENVDAFMKVVDGVRDEEIKGIVAEVDLTKINLNNGKFEVKNNKIALKPQEEKKD